MFCSAKLDAVSRDKIIEEAIKREKRVAVLTTEFTVPNAAKVQIIPEKPNRTTPSNQPTEEQLRVAREKLLALTCVKHIDAAPNQVHRLPITGNMEYGFIATSLVKPDPIFQHNKGHCDVTRYAASYASMKGVSPFHNSNGGGGSGSKAKK